MYAQKEKHTTEEVTVTVDARKKKKKFYPTWNNTEHNTSLGNTEL